MNGRGTFVAVRGGAPGGHLFAASDRFTVLYSPADERCAYAGSAETKDYVMVHTLEHMVARVYVWRFDHAARSFSFVKTHVAENCQSFDASGVDSERSNDVFVTTDGFLDPVALSTATAPDLEDATPLKTNTAWFDAAGMSVELKECASDDGTKVPYFLVRGQAQGGSNPKPAPTVLYGYGGFEISMSPGYSATVGSLS